MRIRVAAQNLQHGGLADEAGNSESRWPSLVERLRRVEPDVLLLNEVRGWTSQGHQQLGQAQKDLGMYAVQIPDSLSGLSTLILFRPDTMGFWDRCNNDLADQTLHWRFHHREFHDPRRRPAPDHVRRRTPRPIQQPPRRHRGRADRDPRLSLRTLGCNWSTDRFR